MKVLIFIVAGSEYSIEIKYVCEVIRSRPIMTINDVPDYIEGVINLRGNIVTIINMRKRFNITDSNTEKYDRIIIVKSGNQIYGILVDSIKKIINLEQGSLSPQDILLKGSDYLIGVGLEDEQMIQMIDVNKFVKENENIEICQ